MEKCLAFINDGELDLNALRIMGVSVKDTDSPIGFFGTGLKYAIATTLRLGGSVEIYVGNEKHLLSSKSLTIRGKPFEQINMNDESLAFTTELGKLWEAWMVVRELLSNTRDEGGTIIEAHADCARKQAAAGKTVILLFGAPFLEVWADKERYFMQDQTPVFDGPTCQIINHIAGSPIFYKGIRVWRSESPASFAYNLKGSITLTEDRTLKYMHQLRDNICRSIIVMEDEDLLERFLTMPEHTMESELDFDISERPGEMFKEVCRRLNRQKPQNLNKAAIAYAKKHDTGYSDELEICQPTEVQKKMMNRACLFLTRMGYAADLSDQPIVLVKWLGEGVLGQAKRGKIYLAERVFDQGTKYVASTILEEIIHNKTGFADCTRNMQTYLFDKIISLGEEMQGEPV